MSVKNFRLMFGPYKGQTLDEISKSDAGLLYLDKVVDESWLWPETRKTIHAFLSDPVIKREIKDLVWGSGR